MFVSLLYLLRHYLLLYITRRSTKVDELSSDSEKANQYSRRNCLRITGLQEKDNDLIDKVVMDMVKAIDVDVTLDDIDRTHRLCKTTPANSAPPRDVIVKFVSYRARQKVHRQRTITLRCRV